MGNLKNYHGSPNCPRELARRETSGLSICLKCTCHPGCVIWKAKFQSVGGVVACVLFDRTRGRVTKQTVRLDRSVEMIVGGCQGFWGFSRIGEGRIRIEKSAEMGPFHNHPMAHPHNHHHATPEVVVDTSPTLVRIKYSCICHVLTDIYFSLSTSRPRHQRL